MPNIDIAVAVDFARVTLQNGVWSPPPAGTVTLNRARRAVPVPARASLDWCRLCRARPTGFPAHSVSVSGVGVGRAPS